MRRRILLMVNGLGLGNSTRCHAICQRLLAAGADVTVVTSGNGKQYFDHQPDVERIHEIEALYYGVGGGNISILRTLLSVGGMLGVMRRNQRRIKDLLETIKPHVVLADSVYATADVRRRGIPLVALNNADVVHVSYRREHNRPRSVRAQFYCIEEMDYLFNRMFPDVVVSPTLDATLPEVGGNVQRIGPIVRPDFHPAPTEGPVRRVLVMLSGSQFGQAVEFTPGLHPCHIDVVGREAPQSGQPLPDNITYHGKLMDNKHLLKSADLMVVNGGFSAVSEAFVLQKPVIVIPIRNHAEQWVNARTVENLGVGVMADDNELEEAIIRTTNSIDQYRAAYRKLPTPLDGAAQAAKVILEQAVQ